MDCRRETQTWKSMHTTSSDKKQSFPCGWKDCRKLWREVWMNMNSVMSWFLNVIWVKTTIPLPPLWGFSGSGQVALKFIYFFNKHFIEGLRVSRQVLGADQWAEENDCGPGPRRGHATFYCHILVRTWVTGGGKCYTKQLMSKRSEKKTGKGDRSVEREWGCRGAGRKSVVTTRKSLLQKENQLKLFPKVRFFWWPK